MGKYVVSALITDFDETITQQDTINPMVQLAAKQSANPASMLSAWEDLSKWYLSQFRQPNPPSLFDAPSLESFLDHYHCMVEEVSLQKVVQQRFLAGIEPYQLRQLGQQTAKKPFANQVLSRLKEAQVRIEILSANWSTDLIFGAVGDLCDQVYSNNLVFDRTGPDAPAITTGEIQLHITSARHKQARLKQSMSQRGLTTTTGAIAYIGDSITDLLAICSADIGLLIGDNQLTHQAMNHFQIPSIEIQLGDRYYPELHQGQVICVQSWKEIELFLRA